MDRVIAGQLSLPEPIAANACVPAAFKEGYVATSTPCIRPA